MACRGEVHFKPLKNAVTVINMMKGRFFHMMILFRLMNEIISFFTTTLSGWDVTDYHSKSLLIIKNRHNFGHNFRPVAFKVDWGVTG